jgi:hypothetical protein
MAKYTTQVEENLPSQGGQIIKHFVQTFEGVNALDLDTQINTFFENLRLIDDSYPIIKSIEYQPVTIQLTPNVVFIYTAMVWYLLSA